MTSRRSGARRVLLIVARLAREKGLLPFLSALMFLSAPERSRLTVSIAGASPAFKEIQRWIGTHDLDVKLLGHKSQAEIAALYAQADGFCLPSLSDPNPLSVIEALWAGLPLLLSSCVGNHPECLQDSENGFCFDPSAPKSICNAVSRWLKLSTGQLDGFGAVSARIAQEKFAPREVIRNFLAASN
ncbi:MAG TPA: glycosyltransferase family 4 protein [Terriglobales bacterium]|nr:glycosyltransferase family 4 protein [Terriglobales bacterium]